MKRKHQTRITRDKVDSKKVFSWILKHIPNELISEVTILLQDSGFVSIKPKRLTRIDWYRVNRSVRIIGGRWVSNSSRSHWRLPLKNFENN